MAIVAKRRSGGVSTGRTPAPRQGRVALVVAAVLAVAALLAWRFLGGSRGGATAPGKVDVAPPEAATPATVPAPPAGAAAPAAGDVDVAPPAVAEDAPSAEPPEPATPGWPPYPLPEGYVVKPGQMALPSGKVLTFPPPGEGETRMVVSSGRIYECDGEGYWRDTTPRQLFGTAFEENFLALSVPGRHFIPAFLVGLDQDEVVEVLKKDYEPKGDETEEEMAQIQAYMEMKGAALDYIAEGGTFDEFVMEFANHAKAERSIHAAGYRSVMELYKAGRTEEAVERYKSLNESMSESGYAPIRLPGKVRKALGLE